MREKWPKTNAKLECQNVEGRIAVFNRKTKKTYVVGESIHQILLHMDGKHTLGQLSEISGKYSEEQMETLMEKFKQMGFLDGENEKGQGLRKIIKFKVTLADGNQFIHADSWLTKLFYIMIVYLSLPFFIAGILVFHWKFPQFQPMSILTLNTITVIDSIILFFVLGAFHELAHAIVARRFDIPVPELGLMLYFFIPCAYTNLTYVGIIKSKKKRMLSLSAGVFSNFLIAGISLLVAAETTGRVHIFFLEMVFVNIVFVISNLMVFLEFDGYYLLEVLLDETRLREKSMEMIQQGIVSRIQGLRFHRNTRVVRYTRKISEEENILFYWIFGILSIIYIPVIMMLNILAVVNILR